MAKAGANKVCFASEVDQSCPERCTAGERSTFEGPTKLLPSAGSSFKVWRKPSDAKSLDGDAEGSTKKELVSQLVISNTPSPQARDNNNTVENPTLVEVEDNLNSGSIATPGFGISAITIQTYEGKGEDTGLNLNVSLAAIEEDERRMKRMLANRGYSRKYRLKKSHYVTTLEKQASFLKAKIPNIQEQIEDNKSQQRSMLIEQHRMKLRMATLEKDRVVKDVEIAHNKAEVERLTKKLQIKPAQMIEHAMRLNNAGAHAAQAQSDPNST